MSKGKIKLDNGVIDQHLGGGLALDRLHEIRAEEARDMASATGFLLALLAKITDKQTTNHTGRPTGSTGPTGKILWVFEPGTHIENTLLFPYGLAQMGIAAERILCVAPQTLTTALWAVDEAARCNALLASVFQIRGNSARFNMTATRRLALRAKTSATPCFIFRHSAKEEASAAQTRWKIKPLPIFGEIDPHSQEEQMRHAVFLERNRNGQTGDWSLAFNTKNKSFYHAAKPSTATKHHTPAKSTASPTEENVFQFNRQS